MNDKLSLAPGEICPACGHVGGNKSNIGLIVGAMLVGAVLGCVFGFVFVFYWFGPDNYFYPMGIIHEILFSAIGAVAGLVVGLVLRK